MSGPDVLGALRNQDFAELCRQHGVTLAVLFGSVAKKKAVRSSDIDLAVMMSSDAMAQGGGAMSDRRVGLLRNLIRYLKTSNLHLVLLNRANSLLRFEIARTGLPVYEAEPGVFAEFCSLALRQHEDSRVFYQAMDRYLARVTNRSE